MTCEIEQIRTFTFPVPFKVVFRHASATRSRAENVIVEARGEGRTGYGEGCPRDYVTGETTPGARDFIEAHAEAIMAEVNDVQSLRAWIASHREVIDRNPAAFCAVETAIIDLFGRLARTDCGATARPADGWQAHSPTLQCSATRRTSPTSGSSVAIANAASRTSRSSCPAIRDATDASSPRSRE